MRYSIKRFKYPYIQNVSLMLSSCVTLFIVEKVRLAQLDLVPLSTKRNYEVEKEIFLAIVLVCKLSCTEWHESGRFVVVF